MLSLSTSRMELVSRRSLSSTRTHHHMRIQFSKESLLRLSRENAQLWSAVKALGRLQS